MNIIKKITISALLSLAAIGLTTSLSAFADGASDAALYCSGCHAGLTVNGVVIGAGARACPQRTATEWSTTIDRMNVKGCGVPAGSIAGIANYLATLSPPMCMNGPPQLIGGNWVCPYGPQFCYNSSGVGQYFYGMYPPNQCPAGMSTTPPPTCMGGLPILSGSAWTCPSTTSSTTSTSSTTTTTLPVTGPAAEAVLYCTSCHNGMTIVNAVGQTAIIGGGARTAYQRSAADWEILINKMIGTGAVIPQTSISGLANYFAGLIPLVTTTTSTTSTSSSTVATTTTTTLCNTYVNGTTQYKYSGSGSCHSFALDLVTGAHIVRDQQYCQKHMTHFNSSGNHVHAYPHPSCM